MNKNSPNTEEILDAIKNMMSEKSAHQDEGLPKDVIELTNPIDEEIKKEDEKIDILELSDPINDKKIKNFHSWIRDAQADRIIQSLKKHLI